MKCRLFHDWGRWSEPKDRMWYAPFNPITNEPGHDHEGQIQERICQRCGKYDWRKL